MLSGRKAITNPRARPFTLFGVTTGWSQPGLLKTSPSPT